MLTPLVFMKPLSIKQRYAVRVCVVRACVCVCRTYMCVVRVCVSYVHVCVYVHAACLWVCVCMYVCTAMIVTCLTQFTNAHGFILSLLLVKTHKYGCGREKEVYLTRVIRNRSKLCYCLKADWNGKYYYTSILII